MLVAGLPTYGYRRVHALMRRQAKKNGRAAPNAKRVYRVMKVHGLLLRRDGEHREEWPHDGQVAVDQRGHPLVFPRAGDRVRQRRKGARRLRAGLLRPGGDGHVATTGGITAEDVQDLVVATVEHRYGRVNRAPEPIEWLTDNGSCYTARDTRTFARDIGPVPRTTPVSS